MFSFAIAIAALASVAVASPAAPVESRALPSGDVTCGSNVYTVSEVSAAVAAGYKHVGSPIGSSTSLSPRLASYDSDQRSIRQLPSRILLIC